MLEPSDPTIGRGALLFAALMFGFAIFLGWWRHAWHDALFWFAIAVFIGSYGMLMTHWMPRLHQWLLIVGLIAGGIAFWFAVEAAFGL
jgi:MFS-type transporter involved in bile tolerance (Atg22 family)